MALLETCCGRSLIISSAVLGVYLLVAYVIAFTFELWWILDPSVTSPVAAYVLCLGYFILFAFSTLLLHGLSIKRTSFLLLWLFTMGILLGPEAGLVLYITIHYWRTTSLNGLIEITCWACRLLVNAIGIVCVQSLHSNWREEKSVLLRLEALKMQTNPVHQINHGESRGKSEAKSQKSKEAYENGNLTGGHFLEDEVLFDGGPFQASYVDPYFTGGINQFDASVFDSAVLDSRLPYLTIRKHPKELLKLSRQLESGLPAVERIAEKSRSLTDLSADKSKKVQVVNFKGDPLAGLPSPEEIKTSSLDRKIVESKRLKFLKRRRSPFCKRKPIEPINVYRINPPVGPEKEEPVDVSDLDSRLEKVFSLRGMYAFEEKTRKIVFYPPEFFGKPPAAGFRSRMNSCGSSSTRSSIDSEDIKQISDVAL